MAAPTAATFLHSQYFPPIQLSNTHTCARRIPPQVNDSCCTISLTHTISHREKCILSHVLSWSLSHQFTQLLMHPCLNTFAHYISLMRNHCTENRLDALSSVCCNNNKKQRHSVEANRARSLSLFLTFGVRTTQQIKIQNIWSSRRCVCVDAFFFRSLLWFFFFFYVSPVAVVGALSRRVRLFFAYFVLVWVFCFLLFFLLVSYTILGAHAHPLSPLPLSATMDSGRCLLAGWRWSTSK